MQNKKKTKDGAAIWLGSWEGDGWRKTELSGEPQERLICGSGNLLADDDDIMMISV